MAKKDNTASISQDKWRYGHLHLIDNLSAGDPAVASAISTYANYVDTNRQSRHWVRCFPAGTLILSSEGSPTPIEKVEKDSFVQGPAGITKVTAKFCYDFEGQLIKIHSSGNLPVECTAEHKFPVIRKEDVFEKTSQRRKRKTISGTRLQYGSPEFPISSSLIEKVSAKDLQEGDLLLTGFSRNREDTSKLKVKDYINYSYSVGRKRKEIFPELIDLKDKDFLRLIGLYLADGTANLSNGTVKFIFSINELSLCKEVKTTIEKVFGLKVKIEKRENWYAVLVFSRNLVQFFHSLCGVKKEKKVHKNIFNSNVCLLPIIDGFLDGDGSTTRGLRNTLCSTSKILINQFRAILLDEGIFNSISKTTHPNDKHNSLFRLRIPVKYFNKIKSNFKKDQVDQRIVLDNGLFGCKITKKENRNYSGRVYDFEVQDENHVYLLDTCVHSSNSVQWIENILFSAGRHYVDDILVSRLTRDSNNDLSVINEATRNIPRPVNDLLGRYTETNIALLTENRPRPRVTPKGNRSEDEDRAELSEMVLEYLWEALDMPELHREIARLILHCGVCWMEVLYDPTQPRRIAVPETQEQLSSLVPVPGGTVTTPVTRQVPVRDDEGNIKMTQDVEYGDLTAKVISPFEMHLPVSHWWNGDDMDWVMREYYTPVSSLKDRYSDKRKQGLTKKNGWHIDALEKVGTSNVRNLPIWWWERLSDLVEGPGPSIYVGTPEQWQGYTTVRIFDRKPSPTWPRGRTIMVAGDQLIYDSPKEIGARAYDPRWPNRWHPYVRFRWEPMMGSIYGRSLIAKLLPKLKRVNAIDTTLIMWRRTVPIAAWISPKGAHPVEDLWRGGAGNVLEYDPRLTAGNKPEPVYPPPYPQTALDERAMQISEMEAIAGTEEILRGQRPTGVTCWIENEKLTDSNGIPVKVSDIKVGDSLMTIKGEGEVGETYSRKYEGEVNTIKALGALDVTITPNHKIPVIDKDVVPTYLSGNRKVNSKTGKREWPTKDNIVYKYAEHVKVGDYMLCGFIRPRDSIEKINVFDYVSPIKDIGGENHGAAKITNLRAKEIRIRLANGETGRSLAKEFNLSEAVVSRIKHNVTYKKKNKSRQVPIFSNISLNSDVLWLFGMYLAEGGVCFDNKNNPTEVRWTLHKKEKNSLGQKIRNILNVEFGVQSTIRERKNQNGIDVCVSNRLLARLFLSLFQTKSHKKRIHRDIFRTPLSLLPLIAGWVDGDGNFNQKSIRAHTVSCELASQMRSILLDEETFCSIKKVKSRRINSRIQYKITIYGDRNTRKWKQYSVRFKNKNFHKNGPEKHHLLEEAFIVPVIENIKTNYTGYVYNVTMNDFKGCSNDVQSFNLILQNSAVMLDVLRKQALASRSAILQAWDESLQAEGSLILQEVIKNVRDDPRYSEHLKVISRERMSQRAIDTFSGSDISDNVQVKVDTASMALVSKEAREQKVLEVLQYLPNLQSVEPTLAAAIIEELGLKDKLQPNSADVTRAKRMLALIRQGDFERVIPFPEDDPFIFSDILIQEMKSDAFFNLDMDQQKLLLRLIEVYKEQIRVRQEQQMQMQIQMMQLQQGGGGQGGQQ